MSSLEDLLLSLIYACLFPGFLSRGLEDDMTCSQFHTLQGLSVAEQCRRYVKKHLTYQYILLL